MGITGDYWELPSFYVGALFKRRLLSHLRPYSDQACQEQHGQPLMAAMAEAHCLEPYAKHLGLLPRICLGSCRPTLSGVWWSLGHGLWCWTEIPLNFQGELRIGSSPGVFIVSSTCTFCSVFLAFPRHVMARASPQNPAPVAKTQAGCLIEQEKSGYVANVRDPGAAVVLIKAEFSEDGLAWINHVQIPWWG